MAKPSGQPLNWDRNSQCQQTAEEIKCKFDGASSKPWQTDLWCYTRVSLQCVENGGVFWALHSVPWNVVIQLYSDVPLGGISLFFMWWRNIALINISHVLEVMLPLWLHALLPKWCPGCTQEMLLQDFLSSSVQGRIPAPGWEQGGLHWNSSCSLVAAGCHLQGSTKLLKWGGTAGWGTGSIHFVRAEGWCCVKTIPEKNDLGWQKMFSSGTLPEMSWLGKLPRVWNSLLGKWG